MVHIGFRLAGAAVAEGSQPEGALRRFAFRPALRAPFLKRLSGGPEADGRLREYLPLLSRLDEGRIRAALTGRYEERLAGSLKDVGSGFPALDFLGSIGGFIDGHVFVAPYVGVHGYFGREREKARGLRDALRGNLLAPGREDPKVGVFVDGMEAVHGVSTMYRNVQALAQRRPVRSLKIVRCGGEDDGRSGGHALRAVAPFEVPLYDGLTLGVPSLLDVLEHVAAEGYDVLTAMGDV